MFYLINYCQGTIPLLVQDSDRVFFFNLICKYCSTSGLKHDSPPTTRQSKEKCLMMFSVSWGKLLSWALGEQEVVWNTGFAAGWQDEALKLILHKDIAATK